MITNWSNCWIFSLHKEINLINQNQEGFFPKVKRPGGGGLINLLLFSLYRI